MKVAVCFFGLNRSLSKTYVSIEASIFNALRDARISYSTFAALMNPKNGYTNPRSGEVNISPEVDSLDSLALDHLVLLDQDEFDKNINLDSLGLPGHVDAYGDQNQSTLNIFRELFSINQVYKLSESINQKFDAYLFLRPDLMYHDKFDLQRYLNLIATKGPYTLLTPSWQKWWGLNDRFAIAGSVAARIYGERIFFIDRYLNEVGGPIHAEKMLLYVAQKNQLNYEFYISETASRVRGSGEIRNENFLI